MPPRSTWLPVSVCLALLASCSDDAPVSTNASAGNHSAAGTGTSAGAANSGAGPSAAGINGQAGSSSVSGTGPSAGGAPGAAGMNAAGLTFGGTGGTAGTESAGAPSGGVGGATNGGMSGSTSGGMGTAGGGSPSGGSGGASAATDVFGIPMLKRSKVGGDTWNSLHWATGDQRAVTGRDPSDPTGYSIRRGDTSLMEIDGDGVLGMGGPQPRLYFQPQTGQAKPFFRDIEFTGYYRRTESDGASNTGFAVGVRAHLNGHGDVDHCLASTYYLIYRNTGTYIFDKELDHPADSPGKGGSLDLGGAIPVGKWIGMKYLAYNSADNKSVKLEAYIDADSNGDGTQPSHWKKLGETVDDGAWNAPTGSCGFPANTVITEGGGVVFIRATAVSKVEYTKLSWREIVDAPAP